MKIWSVRPLKVQRLSIQGSPHIHIGYHLERVVGLCYIDAAHDEVGALKNFDIALIVAKSPKMESLKDLVFFLSGMRIS